MKKKLYFNNILFGMEKLVQIQRSLLWSISIKEKLRPIQIQFINRLYTFPLELNTVTNIALDYNLEKATVSDSLKTLTNKKLIQKERSKKDNRVILFSLTDKGKKTAARIDSSILIIKDTIKDIPLDILDKVDLFFNTIIKGMQQNGIINKSRICYNCVNYKELKNRKYKCKLTGHTFDNNQINTSCKEFNAI